MLYRRLVEAHFELVEIQPLPSLLLRQVVVEVAGGESERVELSFGRQQQGGWSFLIDDARITALPLAHHVDAAAAAVEALSRR